VRTKKKGFRKARPRAGEGSSKRGLHFKRIVGKKGKRKEEFFLGHGASEQLRAGRVGRGAGAGCTEGKKGPSVRR